jgi:phospholipase C
MLTVNVKRSGLVLLALALMAGAGTASQRIAELRRDRDRDRDDRRSVKKIKHIVFIVKENRTFDHYFGTFPGADGATSGRISTGEVVPLGPAPDVLPRDISHSYQSAVLAIDGGALDKFNLIPGANHNGDLLSYTQYSESDIPNYFAYARTFALADHFFSAGSTTMSPHRRSTTLALARGFRS